MMFFVKLPFFVKPTFKLPSVISLRIFIFTRIQYLPPTI